MQELKRFQRLVFWASMQPLPADYTMQLTPGKFHLIYEIEVLVSFNVCFACCKICSFIYLRLLMPQNLCHYNFSQFISEMCVYFLKFMFLLNCLFIDLSLNPKILCSLLCHYNFLHFILYSLLISCFSSIVCLLICCLFSLAISENYL